MSNTMWKNLLLLLVLGSFLTLDSCHNTDNVKKKSLKIFKYNENAGISSTDPAYAKDQSNIWCVNHLYNGLVQLDNQLQIQPCLAKSWKISEDGLTYTFYLRDDVYFIEDKCFESKRRLIASDIVYSFNRIIDSKTASPGAWIFRDKIDNKEAFMALNDTTFQLKLSKPFPPMLSILSMQYTFIVPKEAVEMYGRQFAYHPVGTGPFKMKVWEENSALYLIKNENYFEKDGNHQLPYLDGIKISFIENKKTELLEYKAGKLSFITDINVTTAKEVMDDNGNLLPELVSKSNLSKCPYLKTEYIGFNLEQQKTIDKRIRLALNHCFDRKKIIQYLRNNIGKEADAGMIPYGLSGYDTNFVKGYEYDVEKAKSLVLVVKKEGKLVPFTIYTNENFKEYALYITNEANKIGLSVKVEVVLPVLLREWMTQSKVSCFRASWIADYPEGESYMCLFYSKNGAPPNYTRFKDARFDELYEQSLLENNPEKRIQLYYQMENIVHEASPVIPLYYDQVLRLSQKNIKGLESNAMNLLDLKRVEMDN